MGSRGLLIPGLKVETWGTQIVHALRGCGREIYDAAILHYIDAFDSKRSNSR